MHTFFKSLPKNTKKSYVMQTTATGCEVYIPVDSDKTEVMLPHKFALKKVLREIDEECTIINIGDYE